MLDAQWPLADVQAFIDFLIDHKAEVGDGMSFKGSLWMRATAFMANHTSEGGVKTPSACRTKWARLKEAFQRVMELKNISGLTYHNDSGIDSHGAEDTWSVYSQNAGTPQSGQVWETWVPILPEPHCASVRHTQGQACFSAQCPVTSSPMRGQQ
ncbi:hypothetical protein K439DRAFT_1610262 [Ramaria rubella]|nr:hypothetical protein K439DRAFT_1610262 [Ramaria rubella]